MENKGNRWPLRGHVTLSSESPDCDSSVQTLNGFSALEDAHEFRILYVCELRNLCVRRGETSNFLSWILWSPNSGCLNVVHGTLSVGMADDVHAPSAGRAEARGVFGTRLGYIDEQNQVTNPHPKQ